jgi:hypothetical protein
MLPGVLDLDTPNHEGMARGLEAWPRSGHEKLESQAISGLPIAWRALDPAHCTGSYFA